ncbi:MAG: zinc ABC transporter substrate-binding protein [Chloroflexi bacterium]|nr:zinc ABC transporter substrate-binding protein [Chloroflexota bacterium]
MIRSAIPLIIVLLFNLLTVACTQAPQQASDGKIGVIVSILPQEEFAKSVGGDRVEVTVMVPPGANPHTYEVTPAQMVQLSRAKIYAKVGSPLEFELTWLDKLIAQNKDILVVDCSKGIELMESTDPDEPGIDSHIWTSVCNVKIMVGNICDGLSKIDPLNRQYYEQNRDDYLMKLDSLDSNIKSTLDGAADRTFIVYHPAWGYFARDYGLKQLGIEREGKEPKAAYMARLINEAKTSNIKIIFVSPEFDIRSAETIAHEIGGSVVAISDLYPDYLENMRNVARAIREAFK